MVTYKQAGVDIEVGDQASVIAYNAAKNTFGSRSGLIGEPVKDDGGFAGLLDMGDFYLVQGDDGVGTKIQLAEDLGVFKYLGYDLVAMVADDAICVGAEVVSMTNTIDTNKIQVHIIKELMEGLESACKKEKIVIPGGEIAELGNACNGNIWNATAVGVVKKNKVIHTKNIQAGDKVISLYEPGFRANGFSLVRYILDNNPQVRESFLEKYDVLCPSTIYHSALLTIIGRFSEKQQLEIKGLAHITGGGIFGNINRILKKTGLGVYLDNIWEPSLMVQDLQKLGQVSDIEAYKTWNMGNGMMIVVSPHDAEKTVLLLEEQGIKAQVAGTIIPEKNIQLVSKGVFQKSELIQESLV
jgi:phosphoribosylformylglycinamidine cyclo-ligase